MILISFLLIASLNTMQTIHTEQAVFGGGCFWCTEAIFEELNGVLKVEPGYSGGEIKNPTYKEVCQGNTGHAEVIQITFDPKIVNYNKLLEIFFFTHDPTTLNRQGADSGTQYRSVVFYTNDEQKRKAEEIIKELNKSKVFDHQIVTEVSKLKTFYKAEDNHQNYYVQNKNQMYCRVVISPKLEKFRKTFKVDLKE